MASDYGTAPLWLLGGLFVGGWAGSRLGFGHGACGNYGGGYGPGYGGACAPGYGGGYGPGYGPGYNGYDRPCHEDRQDDKLSNLQAQIAAIGMAEKKDAYWEQKMECAQNQIIDGKIYAATCHKPNGRVFLSPNHIADPFHNEHRVIDSHIERRGFRDDCGRDGFRDGRDGCGCRDGWGY